MYQITIPDSERMFRPFVSDKYFVRVEQMLYDLRGLSVAAQLRHRRIKKIRISLTMSDADGRLVLMGGVFLEIILAARKEHIWPLVVGHEIAHSYITYVLQDRRIENKGGFLSSKEDEALCDHFAFCWLLEGNNAEELARLLAPLAREKEQAPGFNEYQLEMPLWGF